MLKPSRTAADHPGQRNAPAHWYPGRSSSRSSACSYCSIHVVDADRGGRFTNQALECFHRLYRGHDEKGAIGLRDELDAVSRVQSERDPDLSGDRNLTFRSKGCGCHMPTSLSVIL